MTMRFIRLAMFAAIQLGIAQSALAGSTNAAIPYKTIDDLCQMAAGVDQNKLEFRVFVVSRRKGVQPSDITLTIHSAAKGMISVPLGTNELVLHFPH